MSKYNRMRTLLGLALVIISGIFISCSSLPKNSDDKITADNDGLEGTIRFVSNRTDKKTELESLINEFEEIHPKVKVELELIGDAEEILQRKATVGELPDITLVPGAIKVSEYNKYFIPLDDLGFNKDNIYNYASGIGSDGKLYNIDSSISWNGILYNKKIFEEAGIQVIPRTNEEFLEACKKIKAINKVPIAINYKNSWTMSTWVDIVPYAFNNKFEDEAVLDSTNILEKNNGLYKSLNFVRTIVQEGYCEDDLLNYEWEQCKKDIKNGEVVMIFWNSNYKYQLEDIGMNIKEIGMFPLPEINEIIVYGDYRFGISKNTKYPEVAKAFFKFTFEDDRYANAVNILPISKNSDRSRDFFKEVESFHIPVVIHDNILDYGEDYVNINHEKYDSFRKLTGLNYAFVQEYVVSDDVEELTNDLNSRWNELKIKD
ncbi:extracellular solute-binding protein [Clostridium sp. NSJ-6]|uniref:Extracellular solute-binding protein n=1 Tax=Clostridium hominis TaxID=2763036 RepID=A0ABR7DAL0_9CLOT|nr:extracellular solute-binding protein [Clostridium hominis]MBC5627918.1 extracellular solute-binding protein [Clostridium hominis]